MLGEKSTIVVVKSAAPQASEWCRVQVLTFVKVLVGNSRFDGGIVGRKVNFESYRHGFYLFIKVLLQCFLFVIFAARDDSCNNSWLSNLVGVVEKDVGLPVLKGGTTRGKNNVVLVPHIVRAVGIGIVVVMRGLLYFIIIIIYG